MDVLNRIGEILRGRDIERLVVDGVLSVDGINGSSVESMLRYANDGRRLRHHDR